MRLTTLVLLIIFSLVLTANQDTATAKLKPKQDSLSLREEALRGRHKNDSLYLEIETKLLTEYELQLKDSLVQHCMGCR